LWDTSLEPDGHWEETAELTEDHLLTGLGGDGLIEELCDFAGVEMGLETPDAGFTETGELLGEVEGFVDCGEGVVVGALKWVLVKFFD
jgi:hypothetical protein